MEIKVSRINEQRTFDGSKIYTETDITDQVVMPIIDVERLDATLDTSSIVLINTEENAIAPFTRIIIRITNADETTDNIYRLVERDDVTLYKYGTNPKYKHEIQLVEITKWLERFEVDNTTVTNFLAFLYTDDDVRNALGIPTTYVPTEDYIKISGAYVLIFATNINIITGDELFNTYIKDSQLKTDLRYNCSVLHDYWTITQIGSIAIQGQKTTNCSLTEYTIQAPNGQITNVINTSTYTLNQLGKYIITQTYETGNISNGGAPVALRGHFNYKITLQWEISAVDLPDVEKLPTKYTLSQVTDIVLNKVGDETTVVRENIDKQMFALDPTIRAKFDTIIAPEFTFTQDTLFGVLSKIGEVAHAIPRLLPNPIEGGETVDDYSDWNIITYDFLGGDETAEEGEVVAHGSYYDGNDYTTNYISNIQNSFQTNDAEYICLTEPYENGWISPRTEASDYLVTNDEAVIKTSRPIQRIVSLECLWFNGTTQQILDLSRYVKEITDYNLMADYSQDNPLGSKQNSLYYTRGSNVIGGLTYQAPSMIKVSDGWRKRAIENIIRIVSGGTISQDLTIKDLKFRIKYVPFYNLKIKQYKPYINEHSGNNELFYNQINSQTVDIESLGEAMKGALLRVSNEEPNITEYFNNHNECIKSGQLLNDEYYVYQVNKEINNKRVKTTVQFSKDFNKWNAYVAIKKNYREWEISERESIETNPVYSNFCLISDKPEFYVMLDHIVDGQVEYIFETETKMNVSDLNALLPTPTANSPAWMNADSFMVINKVGDRYYKFKRIYIGTIGTWLEEEIFIINNELKINEIFITKEQATAYYEKLQTEKGIMNKKFFEQFVTRMSNRKTTIGLLTGTVSDPTTQTLNDFVQSQVHRDPENYDYIYYTYIDAYNVPHYKKYTYRTNAWISSSATKSEIENELLYIMHKITWAVGNTYSMEWEGGTEYKQIQKTFITPCASLSVGNSLVFDFGAQDNYAMGTYVNNNLEATSSGQSTFNALKPAQEQYVQYGNRFGRVDTLELEYGYGDAIEDAFNTEASANAKSKELYSINPMSVNTNNVLIDYKQFVDYEITLENDTFIVYFDTGKFTLDNKTYHYYITKDNIWYQNGRDVLFLFSPDGAEGYFQEGTGGAYDSLPIGAYYAINTGKKDQTTGTPILNIYRLSDDSYVTSSTSGDVILRYGQYNFLGTNTIEIIRSWDDYSVEQYSVTLSASTQELRLTRNNQNYYSQKPINGMFRINKDSRQSLQFTNQVHFITDNQNIWIGSALAKTMPFVGNTETEIYKVVGFTSRPSKFEIVPDENTYEQITSNWAKTYSDKTYSMLLYGQQAQNNYKGVGILDNKNRLVLYLNREVKTNEYIPTLYIRLRRKM